MSLVSHAKSELERIFTDPDQIMCYIEIVAAFQAKAEENPDPEILIALFKGHHIGEITDDPDEWVTEGKGIWTNTRDPRVISDDGGHTYIILPEDEDDPRGWDELDRFVSIKKEA